MKRTLIAAVCFILLLFNSFPLGVDVDELNSAKGEKIQFINYTGPNPRFTADEIRNWGEKMARDLETGKVEGKYFNFFSFIHVVDPAEQGKFDSDIMSISKYGGVNHIDTLRLILQGFFMYQYGFSQKDATTLAFYVTVYNAVHRGDLTYFGTKYKNKVMSYIDAANAGLAITYKEWPGKTKILVPLSENAKKGDITSLDTTELTDKTVTDALKKEDDKAIEERTDMVDLEERIIEEEKKAVEEDKKTLEEDKKVVEEDKKVTEEDKKVIEEEKKTLEEDKKEVDKITDEEERKAEEDRIAEEEKRIADEEKRVADEEKRIAEEEKRIADEEKRVTDEEKKITEKEDKLEEKKDELAKDTLIEEMKKDPDKVAEEIIEARKEDDKTIYKGKFYYLKVKDYLSEGHYNNEMYIIDAPTGDIVAEAESHNICGRRYDISSKGVVVITHGGSHTAGHYLTLLNLDTLTVIKKGEENIFHRSFVEMKDNFIYAVAFKGDKYYLAKYDLDLTKVAQSVEAIYPDTFITIYDKRIYVNNTAKDILALSTKDLALIEKIVP